MNCAMMKKYIPENSNITRMPQSREVLKAEQSAATSSRLNEPKYFSRFLIYIVNHGTEDFHDYIPQTQEHSCALIDELNIGDRKIHLNKKLEIEIVPWKNGFLAKNKELDIVEFGCTMDEAKDGIAENIIYLIDDIAQEDDKNLTLHAKKLKKILNSYIKH